MSQFLTLFDSGEAILENFVGGGGVDGVIESWEARWKGALVASWRFWPAVNVLNLLLFLITFESLQLSQSLFFLWISLTCECRRLNNLW
jgi:hypothetical protein